MMMRNMTRILLAGIMVLAMAAQFAGCASTGNAVDFMPGIKAEQVSERNADEVFLVSQMELALKLLQASVENEGNVCISPISVQLALAMTANGAAGQTRTEMEVLLGGGRSIDTLNEYLHSYVNSLPSNEKCSLKVANAIWFRDDTRRFTVEEDFLQTNANFYDAQIKAAPFDDRTVKNINAWVREQTDGAIDKILDSINQENIMYLLNAVSFDAAWEVPYCEWDVREGIFVTAGGKERDIEAMHSMESSYLEDGKACGFVKRYAGAYSFAALLPNEGISLESYVSQLTAETLLETLNTVKSGIVTASMPKFSYGYSAKLNDTLARLGMPAAFDSVNADFSAIGQAPGQNIYIGEVLHKTFIGVDTQGTKAGAVTEVAMNATGAIEVQWNVDLNRPFLFMILDNATNLPIFIGTVTDIGK